VGVVCVCGVWEYVQCHAIRRENAAHCYVRYMFSRCYLPDKCALPFMRHPRDRWWLSELRESFASLSDVSRVYTAACVVVFASGHGA